ncbi:hypothetical protein B0H16DRAFT_1540848 [Mycena metata]|uniref:UvrD-like helicase ATP-binding domain-containing protein n=1 Tax=Mycena metata TaxID=1033252 RepID=A0AAD7ND06_9AGAR|nr:hypothetical protein B0H16DRAFT_1540848 [Mycena metata]
MAFVRKAPYRSNLFESTTLVTLEAVENAVSEVLEIVHEGNVQRIMDYIISNEHPAVSRLVVSRLDPQLIMSQFPHVPEAFAGSLVSKVLFQLSEFFVFVHNVPDLRVHKEHYQLVKEAPLVLSTLAPSIFVPEPKQGTSVRAKGKGLGQRAGKMARREATQEKNVLTTNAGPFQRLGIPVPGTRQELEEAKELILVTQQSILKAYLESLRQPAVAASLQSVLIVQDSPLPKQSEEPLEAAQSDGDFEKENSSSVETISPIFQQPLKFSSLYRRRATGFGQWKITMAPRAEHDLRDYSRRDRKTFGLIVDKMRDLSNGVFSAKNCRQINNGSSIEVAIYEAKVTNQLRLVYQIDCGPIHGTNVTLKIFGVYEEAKLTRGSLWESMSRELRKRGEGYRDRCAQRQLAAGAKDSLFLPLQFPAQEDGRLNSARVPDLPADDVEEVRFAARATVQTSLFESIVADLDVAFVLEISPKELEVVEHPHSCYVLGRSGTGKTTTMLYKMLLIEATHDTDTRKYRQMFVTKSRTLADKVGEHFGKLLGGHRPSAVSENAKAAIKADRVLILENETDWRSDLPRKYSDLQDADFPLFLSFDQLCAMIERDMEAIGVQNTRAAVPWLSYKTFESDYWPHFPQTLRKGFGPSTIFSEFLGVIMGSEQALLSKHFCLEREAYLNLADRGHSTFAGQRERIYDLFKKYVSQKRRLGDRDAADRTHAILEFFRTQGSPGRKIDFLLVSHSDPTDGSIDESSVLRSLSQTINVGSSFRFNELKAFLFRIEQRRREKHPELNFQQITPPRTFQLTLNHRSHSGIVNCAHSIVELITKLWPDAIDVLERERGTVDGPRPIFFTNWDGESPECKQFLFGNQRSGGHSELGAHQCILVRDEAAREKLHKEVGDIGLILNLYESKGLEFNDASGITVLLYNFFEDSNVLEAQWRVVLNTLSQSNNVGPTPTFDKILHANVCTELKFLYVAITRARSNIWIADCSTKGEPMRMLWTSKDLVENRRLEGGTPRFASSTTAAADWEERGRSFFESEHFSQARLCYERAKMPREAAVAHAYHLRERAAQVPSTFRESGAKKAAFSRAADAFVACSKNYAGEGALVYLRRAGECFEHSGDTEMAIHTYYKGRHFDDIAELYRTGNKFDEAVAVVETHRRDMDPEKTEKVISAARLFYLKKGQIQKALPLFKSPEEALECLQRRDLHTQQASLLQFLGKFSAAAEIHFVAGRILQAAELFIQDRTFDRASECVLQALWDRISFMQVPNSKDPPVSRLLALVAQVDWSTLPQSVRDEASVIQAIVNREVAELQRLGRLFERNNPALALLCLEHHFNTAPEIRDLPTDALEQCLQNFRRYKMLLKKFANANPCSSESRVYEKVFGFRRVEGQNNYSIGPGTFLHRSLRKGSNGSTVVSGSTLRTVFSQLLKARLKERVQIERDIMARLPPPPAADALAATGVTILQPERRESKQDGEDVLRDGEGSLGDLKELRDGGKLASKSEDDVLSEDGQVETDGHHDAPIATLKWSEQEAVAAGRIQHAVLRARHRVENEQSELSTQLSQFFEECHGKSATTEMDRLYRVHFLGPLPHLLLCLQMAYKQAQGEKAEASKEIATAQGEALERADMNYKEMQRILKAVNRVQKMLRPSARESIHTQGDVNKLKGVAGEAILLLGNLPFNLAPAVQEHLKIASKVFLDVERDQA